MKYAAPFKIMDLRNKLQTALGKTMDVNLHQSTLTVVEVDGEKPVCEILVSVSGDETTVTVSGLNMADAKAGFTGTLDNAAQAMKDHRRGAKDLLESVLHVATTAIGAAGEVGETLAAGNTIASTIEKYGADLERKAQQIRNQQRQAESDEKAREAAKTTCVACGAAHGGGTHCSNCGTPTGLTPKPSE